MRHLIVALVVVVLAIAVTGGAIGSALTEVRDQVHAALTR